MSDNQEVAAPEQAPKTEPAPTLSGDPKTTTPEPVNIDWRQSLPEDIKADKSLESIKDVASLAKSYIHAQKMVGSDKIPVPNKYATDKDWSLVYEKLGRPKSPDGYKYDLPQDKQVDEASLKSFSDQAHRLGLLPTQANGVVKFYNDMVAKTLQDADSKALAARENGTKQLKQEWGQAYQEKLTKANTLASSVLKKDFLNNNLADGTKLGDHPMMVKAFAALADKMGEDNIVQASGPSYLTPSQIEKQIGELTQVGSAYWDKNHPNHDAAVQEVFALREKKNQV
jgi:aminoglycoside/choline kinase family phosphotransferase